MAWHGMAWADDNATVYFKESTVFEEDPGAMMLYIGWLGVLKAERDFDGEKGESIWHVQLSCMTLSESDQSNENDRYQ